VLLAAFTSDTHMLELQLSHNALTSTIQSDVVNAMCEHPALREVDLRHNWSASLGLLRVQTRAGCSGSLVRLEPAQASSDATRSQPASCSGQRQADAARRGVLLLLKVLQAPPVRPTRSVRAGMRETAQPQAESHQVVHVRVARTDEVATLRAENEALRLQLQSSVSLRGLLSPGSTAARPSSAPVAAKRSPLVKIKARGRVGWRCLGRRERWVPCLRTL